jgi:hypothetical protein
LSLIRLVPWSCSAEICLGRCIVEGLSCDEPDAPVSANRMLCSYGVNGSFDGGVVDDPSDGAGCGADPDDARGRSTRGGELLGLSASPSSSPSLSLTDESGLKGSAAWSSEDVESSVSTSSDKDDFPG